MIYALGSLSGTSWGAIVVLLLAAAFVAGVFAALKLATRDTTGVDAEDKAALREVRMTYGSPPPPLIDHDVEDTPDDEEELPFEPLRDKSEEWALERLAQIREDVALTVTPATEGRHWLPTPPEVAEALASGSGMTGFTRQAMRELRMELGEEAIR